MRRSLVAVTIGFGLTVVLFVLGGMAGSACRCMTPMAILFPYGTAVGMSADWETAGLLLITVQFPLYAWVLITAPAGKRLLLLTALAVVHAAAVTFWLYF